MDTGTRRPRRDASSTPYLFAAFRLSKLVRAILGLKLAGIGVAIGQDHLLAVLEPGRSIHVGPLADALGVRPSTVSKMVDRLVASGWIERETDPDDTRKTFIALTPLGECVRRQVLDVWAEIDADLRTDLPDVDYVERQVRAFDDRLTAYVSRLR